MGGNLGTHSLGRFKLGGSEAAAAADTVVTGMFDAATPAGTMYDTATPDGTMYDSPSPGGSHYDPPTPA